MPVKPIIALCPSRATARLILEGLGIRREDKRVAVVSTADELLCHGNGGTYVDLEPFAACAYRPHDKERIPLFLQEMGCVKLMISSLPMAVERLGGQLNPR